MIEVGGIVVEVEAGTGNHLVDQEVEVEDVGIVGTVEETVVTEMVDQDEIPETAMIEDDEIVETETTAEAEETAPTDAETALALDLVTGGEAIVTVQELVVVIDETGTAVL